MLVSVVVPTTDRSDGFMRCIDSILRQTYSNLEIIVVGNNYHDIEIIPSILAKYSDSRICYYYLESCSNANVARNFGVSISNGEYVAFMDSDDYWMESHIGDCVSLISLNSVALYSGYYIDNGSTKRLKLSRAIEAEENPLDFLFGANPGVAQTSSFFLNRSIFESCKWDEQLKRNQDYDFFVRVHDLVGWTFKESVTCNVFWKLNSPRSFHYESYVRFFDKHSDRMSDISAASYVAELLYSYSLVGEAEYNNVLKDFTFNPGCLPLRKRLFVMGYLRAVCARKIHYGLLKFKQLL